MYLHIVFYFESCIYNKKCVTDIEVTELEVTDLPSPDHSPIVQRKIAPVRRVKKVPLQTPNFKWKTKGNFRPKEHYFDSSKVNTCSLLNYV